jgi:hypothetical protein
LVLASGNQDFAGSANAGTCRIPGHQELHEFNLNTRRVAIGAKDQKGRLQYLPKTSTFREIAVNQQEVFLKFD